MQKCHQMVYDFDCDYTCGASKSIYGADFTWQHVKCG